MSLGTFSEMGDGCIQSLFSDGHRCKCNFVLPMPFGRKTWKFPPSSKIHIEHNLKRTRRLSDAKNQFFIVLTTNESLGRTSASNSTHKSERVDFETEWKFDAVLLRSHSLSIEMERCSDPE
jgi:hypothetical protein